jgi:glucosamine-phosphate N-acetyltransferase
MIHIRPCRLGDFEAIVLLLRQLWADKELNPSELRPVFERTMVCESKRYLCATDGSRLVGFGSCTLKDNLWPDGPLAYVDELVVDGECRDKGVGGMILEELARFAAERGCCRIELDCAFYREEAGTFAFYEKLGFVRRAVVFSKVL